MIAPRPGRSACRWWTGGLQALVAALFWATSVHAGVALDPNPLPPGQEARAEQAMRGLRCLVCQNESIADSDADLARDLRRIVRERIKSGDSPEQAQQFLVARYGDWVLLDPPFKPDTALLWLSPAAILVLGGAALVLQQRRRARRGAAQAEGAPLDAAERRRLERALAGDPADADGAGRA